jgi:hypothetical protein
MFWLALSVSFLAGFCFGLLVGLRYAKWGDFRFWL